MNDAAMLAAKTTGKYGMTSSFILKLSCKFRLFYVPM
jgi:hypothetical protein